MSLLHVQELRCNVRDGHLSALDWARGLEMPQESRPLFFGADALLLVVREEGFTTACWNVHLHTKTHGVGEDIGQPMCQEPPDHHWQEHGGCSLDITPRGHWGAEADALGGHPRPPQPHLSAGHRCRSHQPQQPLGGDPRPHQGHLRAANCCLVHETPPAWPLACEFAS